MANLILITCPMNNSLSLGREWVKYQKASQKSRSLRFRANCGDRAGASQPSAPSATRISQSQTESNASPIVDTNTTMDVSINGWNQRNVVLSATRELHVSE